MEESGENWPSDSDLELCDNVIFDDGDDDYNLNEKELSERMLELSATIPGSNKMDDTSILDKAKNYVKQLQERVKELEQHAESNKSEQREVLLEVEAKVLQREVLITIHCEKQNGVMVNILTQLEKLHLLVTKSSVLQFGESTFGITIVAQMGDGYNITVEDLEKTLRVAISTQ